jgi:hypothetical protein
MAPPGRPPGRPPDPPGTGSTVHPASTSQSLTMNARYRRAKTAADGTRVDPSTIPVCLSAPRASPDAMRLSLPSGDVAKRMSQDAPVAGPATYVRNMPEPVRQALPAREAYPCFGPAREAHPCFGQVLA